MFTFIARLTGKDSYLLDFGQGCAEAGRRHMGHLDFHTSRHPCVIDSDRQWLTASTPESEYSGGQWFLNHLCGWNRSASSPRGNKTLVTRVGAETLQWGLCQFKKPHLHCLFVRRWQVIWKTGDSCVVVIRFSWNGGPHTIIPNREPSFFIYQMWRRAGQVTD